MPDTKDCLTADSDDHVVVISIEYFDTKRSKKKLVSSLLRELLAELTIKRFWTSACD